MLTLLSLGAVNIEWVCAVCVVAFVPKNIRRLYEAILEVVRFKVVDVK